MTVREWWYKTAAVDVLKRMVDNDQDVCVRALLKPSDKWQPCPECARTDDVQDCHKCMENLLNEKLEK